MALDDTLFQLGMDLASRSSTAQKEDEFVAAPVDTVRKETADKVDGNRFAGKQLIVDLHAARRLDDIAHVERTLKRCVEAAGATLLDIHLHRFGSGGGISGVAVLAGAHITFHSWPEAGYAALDVFMRGDAKPEATVAILQEAFAARGTIVREQIS